MQLKEEADSAFIFLMLLTAYLRLELGLGLDECNIVFTQLNEVLASHILAFMLLAQLMISAHLISLLPSSKVERLNSPQSPTIKIIQSDVLGLRIFKSGPLMLPILLASNVPWNTQFISSSALVLTIKFQNNNNSIPWKIRYVLGMAVSVN